MDHGTRRRKREKEGRSSDPPNVTETYHNPQVFKLLRALQGTFAFHTHS